MPTGTDTLTTPSLATSIMLQPTLSTTQASSTAIESGIPSSMPRIIQPPGGIPATPRNTTLVQVGFGYPLNYPFVVSTAGSANQIFTYLPQGIAYGLGLPNDQVTMHALQPFDTTKTLGYITTLALAYIPSDMVSQLTLDLHTPVSNLYSNPDPSIKTLMSMINPSFAVLSGASLDGGDASAASNPALATSASVADGAPIGGDSGNSAPVKGTSVGIGVGVVAGAAVYGAAMFLVARRYKKRRQRHQRTPSVPARRGMSQVGGLGGGAFMSGGRGGRVSPGSRYSDGSSNGRSVRDQGISAPVMAENSLGWN
ncbi:hypothetical protein LTR04_002673 [Oleoguttula sp. CCFEE 6159]|nr:hypothetical protein LTR04_002673 [Oleoguttula sp. CCFEE 6159]